MTELFPIDVDSSSFDGGGVSDAEPAVKKRRTRVPNQHILLTLPHPIKKTPSKGWKSATPRNSRSKISGGRGRAPGPIETSIVPWTSQSSAGGFTPRASRIAVEADLAKAEGVSLFDCNGRFVTDPKLVIDERSDRLRAAVKRQDAMIDHCVLCNITGGDTIRCNICLDRAHIFCLVTFALELENKFSFLGWRAPHTHDLKDLRSADARAGALIDSLQIAFEEQEKKASSGNEGAKETLGFYCPACESNRLGRDFVQCLYCNSDRHQTSILKCMTPRCSNGIHVTCLLVLENLYTEFIIDQYRFLTDELAAFISRRPKHQLLTKEADKTYETANYIKRQYQDWCCPVCQLDANDIKFPEERIIPAELLYLNYPNSHLRLDTIAKPSQYPRILEKGMHYEADFQRSDEWAKSWFPPEMIIDQTATLEVAKIDSSRITPGCVVGTEVDSALPPSCLCAVSETTASSETPNACNEEAYWRELGAEVACFVPPCVEGIDSLTLEIDKLMAEYGDLEECLKPTDSSLSPVFSEAKVPGVVSTPTTRRKRKPGRTASVLTETAIERKTESRQTDYDDAINVWIELRSPPPFLETPWQELSLLSGNSPDDQAVKWLDDNVCLRKICAYLFSALAREYDEIEAGDIPHPIRHLFGETWDPLSPVLTVDRNAARPLDSLTAEDPGYPRFVSGNTSIIASGQCRYEIANEVKIVGKTLKQYGKTLQIPPLMYSLLILYERLEELHGRQLFRDLFIDATKRATFTQAKSLPSKWRLLSSWNHLFNNEFRLPVVPNRTEILGSLKHGFEQLWSVVSWRVEHAMGTGLLSFISTLVSSFKKRD
eukprot:Gregarina_sp_Poly_1__729@NODE_1173_length_4867_cov_47_652708_g804_i0_p1_GENE_NODE_1173_length_4867_cov_47_652708_g804_i0NODE_1173_length_4867_cov_47_652708_g804_i0_p1_ORF_typecomplete_len830_score86_38zfHC5HC2H_2/PF13832_6/0_22zfHC5HC2H_2/PF13832_6/0_035zfHC5HC2H_2/PF13832_6/2_4e03zfHC5HC2H/PF13771_6/0_073zfHC5HC2H/PF13771_6/0_0085zfHC5HC2H/PF13771_6/9_4e03zfHC5HC2H/PF13771_6/5_4e03PHD/PF00628_29/2_2PHD/PF00628_29/2_9e02PHD/PF00628_29/14PHD/PF00628_29/89_NODE_1173_length_4867_cov_47_652708_g804_